MEFSKSSAKREVHSNTSIPQETRETSNKQPQISSVQLLSHVWLFATPQTAAPQASLSITNSWSLPKLLSIESGMPSNNLILCHPLLLLPSIFPSIRVFSNESALRIRWPKYWNKQPNLHLKQLEKEEEEQQQQKHKKPPQLVEGKKS